MTTITYEALLQAATPADLQMLSAFAFGQRVQAADAAEAEALFAVARRLHEARLLTELHRVYVVRADGTVGEALDGFLVPVAKAYVTRLASERVRLSRDPLPEA